MITKAEYLRKRVEEAVIPDDPMTPLDEFQAAKLLNMGGVFWLRAARSKGTGPEFFKTGTSRQSPVRYTREALTIFLSRLSRVRKG